MKKYYIVWGDFGNEYSLWYTDRREMETALPPDAERITRKEAISYCAAERYRRKHDQTSSGYADTYIYPTLGYDPSIGRREVADGYIVLPNRELAYRSFTW